MKFKAGLVKLGTPKEFVEESMVLCVVVVMVTLWW